jgi:hypothetical protein
MYKMLKDSKYSSNGVNCICVSKGDVVDLPGDLGSAWVSNGTCELNKKPKFNPVKETAVVNPVEETKTKRKTKKK